MDKKVKQTSQTNIRLIDEDIASGDIKRMYLLYGDENYLKKVYRDKLKKAVVAEGDTMNLSSFAGKDIEPEKLIDLAETMPFFAERRLIVVENSGFFKDGCEVLAKYLADSAQTTTFLFVEDEADGRSKMLKTVAAGGRAIQFVTQKQDVLERWVLQRLNKEGRKITGNVMQLFLERTGTDMGNIDRELEKLICYTMGREVIEAADVDAVITERPENKVFEMIGAIGEHNKKRALELYADLLELREPPLRILYNIARQFRILLDTREMMKKRFDEDTMAKYTGVPPFAVRKNIKQARNFTVEDLKGALDEIAELETAAKSGRLTEPEMTVEIFIVKYAQKKPA
jgi:DNA polymerase-3 subunit delta